MTLQQAIDDLYHKTKVLQHATSTARLRSLAGWCVEEIEKRGLPDVGVEVTLPGGGRNKCWDVSWSFRTKPRLGITLKSLLENMTGSVPNRIDELVGECANLQMVLPEIVVGYVCVIDVARDSFSKKHGMTWVDFFESHVLSLSGRVAKFWTPGTIESFLLLKVDFSSGPQLLTPVESTQLFFDTLVEQVNLRNPDIA